MRSAEPVAKFTPCSLISSLMVHPTASTLSPLGVSVHWSMEPGTPPPSLSRGAGGGGGGGGAGAATSTILGAGGGGGGGSGAPNIICTPTPKMRSDGSLGPYSPGLAHSRRYLASVRSC